MPIRSVPRALPVLGVMVATTAAAAALTPASMWGYDSSIMFQVAHSMVSGNGFRVYDDPINANQPYASYAVGMSLLMVLGELVSRITGIDATRLDVFINPILLGLIAGVLWLVARRSGLSTRQAALVSLIVSLGTLLLPYAVTTFSEIGVALGVSLCLWSFALCRDRPLAAGMVCGAGMGLAGLLRQDSFILIVPVVAVGLLVATDRAQRKPALLGLLIGVTPAIVLTAGYNLLRFGSPLTSQYAGLSLRQSFSQPFWTGFYGLTASPGRGLLLYVPLVVIVAIAAKWAWQRSPVLTVVCSVLLLDRVVFYSTWWAWHGGVGWGPRFLAPAMPALAPFVVEAVRRLPAAKMPARLAFAGLVALSFAVQLVGAITSPGGGSLMAMVGRGAKWDPAQGSFMAWAVTQPAMATWTDPMLDWSVFPIPEQARQLLKHQNILSEYLVGGHMRPVPLAIAGLLIVLGLAAAMASRPSPQPSSAS